MISLLGWVQRYVWYNFFLWTLPSRYFKSTKTIYPVQIIWLSWWLWRRGALLITWCNWGLTFWNINMNSKPLLNDLFDIIFLRPTICIFQSLFLQQFLSSWKFLWLRVNSLNLILQTLLFKMDIILW